MSSPNKTNPTYADQCISIVQQFNQPQVPVHTNDFRSMMFRAMMTHTTNERNSLLHQDDFHAMLTLWNILDDVDKATQRLTVEQ